MKKHFGHILFFVLASVLLTCAGILAFNGMSSDFDHSENAISERLCLDEAPVKNLMDTDKYCDEPCYQFKQFETSVDGDTQTDVLSKTIVRVENINGDYEDIDKVSIKKFSANQSLNLMIEKYTLKRQVINSNASFFVTMESFNTKIEHNAVFGIDIQIKPDYETSLNADQIDQIKAICNLEASFRFGKHNSRPL